MPAGRANDPCRVGELFALVAMKQRRDDGIGECLDRAVAEAENQAAPVQQRVRRRADETRPPDG